jgi:adenosylmethionine-8-amino-7-oxononanoate aminotransferase
MPHLAAFDIQRLQNEKTESAYRIRQVGLEAQKRGVIIRPLGNVMVLMPPLSITREELKRLTQVVFDSIEAVFS